MIDYKTDRPWNMDIARKNMTRAIGYLRRVQDGGEIDEVIAEACRIEQKIEELIEELGTVVNAEHIEEP